jgi:hypothetical protein
MRIRNAFWILVMLAMPAFVLAQQTQPSQSKPAQKPAAETQKAPEPAAAPAQTAEPAPTFSSVAPKKPVSTYPPAPKPGHPLDPADVDVLTGKSKPASPYGGYGYRVLADPYSGFGYPYAGAGLDQSVFSTPGGSMLSGVPSFAVGQIGGRRFFFVNGTQAGLPILFFNRGSDRAFIFLGRGLSIF